MSEKKIYISEGEETAAQPESPRKRTPAKGKRKEEQTYEEAVTRLEEIVRTLEQSREGIGLEESMKLYEEGVALVRRCYRELEAAEQRVKVLQQSPDGEITAVDFPSGKE